ncbi:MAG TPA: CPBP family intramembrane glutamic endopeptidase [Sphingomicrobium sp.]
MERAGKSTGARLLSAVEFMLAAAVVVAHNVWRALPNEVPILTVAALLSVRLRQDGWAALGFRRPKSWVRVILIAFAAVVLRLIVSDPIEAALTPLWGEPATPAVITAGPHDARWLITTLALVWTFAAIGEEIGYRGYVTLRGAEALGASNTAWVTATIAAAVLFGLGHYYKGPVGMVDSGVAGLILGAAYLLSGRCLWTTVLAHGLIDTTGVLLLYSGLAS